MIAKLTLVALAVLVSLASANRYVYEFGENDHYLPVLQDDTRSLKFLQRYYHVPLRHGVGHSRPVYVKVTVYAPFRPASVRYDKEANAVDIDRGLVPEAGTYHIFTKGYKYPAGK